MDLLLRRRMMMMKGAEPEPEQNLIYHWRGSDGLTNNQWVDVIGGIGAAKNGSPTNDGSSWLVYNSGYFAFQPNNAGFNIGKFYKIVVDFSIPAITSRTAMMVDLGSWGNSNHGFCVAYDGANGEILNNYKVWPNSGQYIIRIPISILEGEKRRVEVGCVDYDGTNSREYIKLDTGEIAYSEPHEATPFNANFGINQVLFGKGYVTDVTGSVVKIYSIKIYNYDNA